MFDKFKSFIKGVFNKMFNKSSIENALNVNIAVSEVMANEINLWSILYENKAPWLGNTVSSMNLSATIASEVARMVTLELESEITKNSYLNEQYQTVINDLRVNVEYACAKGGLAFKPYISGDTIAVDYVQADKFYPVQFNSRKQITAAIFIEQKADGNKTYTRLEYHELKKEGYYIKNLAYVATNIQGNTLNNNLGDPIPLTKVEEWAELEPEVLIKDVKKPLFAYFKVPFANNTDNTSPLGVSIYARAIDILKEADKQWSRILWEYEGSELAIDADTTLFKRDHNGNSILPRGKERLFRTMDMDMEGTKSYNIFSPEIRDSSHFNGLNNILKKIEFNCGLAYGTISDPQEVDKTATEVISTKQRMYHNVKDIQKSLENSLVDLSYAMNVWAKIGRFANSNYDISFKWDDSIVVDKETELASMQADVVAGLIRPELYIMKKYGVTKEEALEMMPKIDNTLTKSPFDEE